MNVNVPLNIFSEIQEPILQARSYSQTAKSHRSKGITGNDV